MECLGRGIDVKNRGLLMHYSRLYSYSNAYTVCGASSCGRVTLILLWGVRGVRMCVGNVVLNLQSIWEETLGRKQTTNQGSRLALLLCDVNLWVLYEGCKNCGVYMVGTDVTFGEGKEILIL